MLDLAIRPVRGDRAGARLPLALLGTLSMVLLGTVIAPPAGRLNWLLEVGPGLAGVIALIVSYRRFPMSRLIYFCVFVHILILTYGGYHTYAETPLGNWAKEAFGWERNHYDRVGHLALGVFPVFIVREVLLRATPLQRGGWLTFLCLSVILAAGAFWELLEWWSTLVFAEDVGQAFLGSQGDVWDAQWDMFLALVGSGVALLVGSGMHDRSMAALLAGSSPTAPA